MRHAIIPEEINRSLESEWSHLSDQKKSILAEAIVKMSNHFQDKEGLLTPWNESDMEMAYRFYFFPLNLARGYALFETLRGLITEPLTHLFDIGAGFGNLKYLKNSFPDLLTDEIVEIERFRSDSSQKVLQEIPAHLPEKSTGFYSYSWVEMKTPLEKLLEFDTLIFLEPSSSVNSRKIMALRQDLLKNGFHPIAPCTHLESCPLLIHSQKDFCHDRVPFEKPGWFEELESLLPMKNNTLTYTYLVVSKSIPFRAEGKTRVIGDTLKEKGKTRQAICFDDQRRFLSWLKKEHKKVPFIEHGSLISIENAEEKSAEMRVNKSTHIEEFAPGRKTETH